MQEINFNEHNSFNQQTQINENDMLFKSREFGKDITNAFIGMKSSLDQNFNNKPQINTKQAKLADFKNFIAESKQTIQPTKKFSSQLTQVNYTTNPLSQSTTFLTNRFNGAPKQSLAMLNLKKNMKKQTCLITSTQNQNTNNLNPQVKNAFNNLTISTGMEIDSEIEIKPTVSFNESCRIDPLVKALTTPLYHTFNPFGPNQIISQNSFIVKENEEIRENIQEAGEYIESIFTNLKEFERENPDFYPTQNYMKINQYDINEKMRAILLDWLVEVHLKFKLLPETFFLTINLIDRYLEKRTIQRTKLQLVGITAMLIACKYEEIYAPEVKDFVFITDKAYTNKEVLEMEFDILKALQFNVTMPSSLRFSELYNYFIKLNSLVMNFVSYLLDLVSVDYKMMKYKASLVSAAVIYVSSKLLHKEKIFINQNIDKEMEKLYNLSEYSEEEIKICAKDVCLIYDYSDKTGLAAIKKKYSLPKFNEVAKIKFGNNK